MKPEQEARASRPTTLAEWGRLACQPSVAKRGLKFAVVVGAVLIAINHSDAIIRGELQPSNYLKMGLTVVVPYVVSVLSSVGAMLE
ncbi:MAG: nitrate/nitrite transporter NrtS [Longimicrobiales bacterium]